MAGSVDRRLILAGGAALALAAGLIAAAVIRARGQGPTAPPPASQGGLVVQSGRDDDIKLDPRRPLRCFVGGRLIGEFTLDECARRNGVATGALDVGLDPSGALAAGQESAAQITPLPPPAQAAPPLAILPERTPALPAAPDAAPILARAAPATCWRYAGGTWIAMARAMSLGACVQSLYDGQCERPGAAAYGRWGDRTLRLIAGRIEISRDNRTFSALMDQGQGCTVLAPE